jgi:8-oxo-dGTP diphosphatase
MTVKGDVPLKIIENYFGIQFLDFISIDESDIDHFHPLAGSFAVVECVGKYLICYNKKRNQWELPAGKRELGETPKECAIRELYEETGQLVTDMNFIGLMKLNHKENDALKYNPVYFTSLNKLQPFIENAETAQIRLWLPTEKFDPMDSIDFKLLELIYKGNV